MQRIPPISAHTATDAQLIESCREGDQGAYGQIVERYQSLVCSITYSRCGDLRVGNLRGVFAKVR
jgi:hypothetical protein